MSEQNPMQYKNTMPVLPLRDIVIFPRVVMSLSVGRTLSLGALEMAESGQQAFLVTQRSAATEEPTAEDLYSVGCVANILQTLKLPDDTVKVLVEGVSRSKATFCIEKDKPILANIEPLPMEERPEEEECIAMCRALQTAISHYAKTNRKLGSEFAAKIEDIDDVQKMTDLLASSFPMPVGKQQEFLEMSSYSERVDKLLRHIARETEMQKIERKIRGRVKEQVEKNHREYYLQEQMRAIQKEMGDDTNELEDFKKRIKEANMPEQAKNKCEQEIKKLRQMAPMSAEASVTRSYIDTLLSLPWTASSELIGDIRMAEKTLNDDHYGLEKIKERVLEYLAVQKRSKTSHAPILCFVGPPGVGKTSLGRSIAAAIGRQYIRIALGGVRDEAELRGHRRTYVGAMPGRIINSMIRAKVKNPLILLDEIDKMGMDFRGDPSAALLEVLDPEQNSVFSDHYIEVDYDLSDVMFVTTANSMNIPLALQDRLEVIRLSGYTETEKVHIATNHLVPRQITENGLKKEKVHFPPQTITNLIRHYTRESGVRSLERKISSVCRKVVLIEERKAAKNKGITPNSRKITISPASLKKYIGVEQFRYNVAAGKNKIGQVNGLAWTEVGGDLLSVEACSFPGKGKIIRTGKLGEVMCESVITAFSVIHTRAADFQIPANFAEKSDFHIHFPEGAIPKDGPSAGIAIATALLSLATSTPVRADTAMTGEITLRGEVLPIGGIKEKLLAAVRGGIRRVILPKENEKDLSELPPEIKDNLEIIPVKWINEVFHLALEETPTKKPADKKRRMLPKSKSPTTDSPLVY